MSSLFNQASLVVEPAVYETSKVYATKPFDGSGDLTFTRSNDTATRVGPDGLIEKVRTSLFTYNTDFTNVAWAKQSTTAVADQIANPVNGAVDADLFYPNSTGTYRAIRRTIGASVAEVGISIYAKAGGKNILFFNDSGGARQVAFDLSAGTYANTSATAISMESLGDGWYRCAFSAITEIFYMCVSDGTGSSSVTANGTDGIYIWGQQTEYGVPTEFIGVTTSAAVSVGPVANVPRLDYSGGSSCPRLILEGQRTNSILWSEQLENWGATNTTVTTNVLVSPDGYQNADTIVINDSTSRVSQNLSLGAGTYTASVYAKLTSGSGTARINLTVDGSVSSFNFTPTTEWVRYTYTVTAATELTTIQLRGLSGTPTVSFWGAQLEAGAYATSYIPTLGAAVTRGADAASKTGISSLIGQTEGTIFVEFDFQKDIDSPYRISLSDGTVSNRIQIGTFGNEVQVYVQTAGVTQVFALGGTITTGTHKMALAYASNDYVAYLDGSAVITDTSASVPACSKLGFEIPDGTGLFEHPVNQALLFKTRLTNAQMQELTSL